MRDRYGDVFTIHVEQRAPWVMLGHPDHVKQVFTGDPNVLHAGEGNNILKPLLGARSVLLLDGKEHMQHRKALLPPFHGERMQAYGDMIRAIAQEEVAGWPVGTPLATRLRTQELTLEIIMRAVFGSRDERLRAALHGLLEFVGRTSTLVLSVMGGQRANKAVFDRVRVPVDALLGELITARRADPDLEEHADILSMLLAGTDMDDATLKDELLTLLVAGHETTATALAWALERLARHPGAWERLRQGDDDYLDAVCKETLRLRPVLPGVIRMLKAAVRDRGLFTARGHRRGAVDPPHPHPRGRLPGPARVPPGAVPGEAGGHLHVDPVRRRRTPLPGRDLRAVEMKWVLRAIAEAVVELQPGSPHAEDTKHRSITLAPKADGRVIVARRTAPVRRAQPVPTGR